MGKNGVKSVREMLGVLGSGHAVEGHLAPANDRNSATFDPSFDMGDGQSHTFASHAAMSKETLPMIRRLLGHATHQSTARHAHLDDEHLLDAAQRVGNAIERLIRWITKSPDAFAAVPPQIST